MAERRANEKLGDGIDKLEVALTRTELLDFADKLAKLQTEQAEHDKKLEAIKREFKAKEADLAARREYYSTSIANRAVVRDVQVEHWANWETNKAWTVRLDTGETYGERVLSAGERQRMLDLVGANMRAPVDDVFEAQVRDAERAAAEIDRRVRAGEPVFRSAAPETEHVLRAEAAAGIGKLPEGDDFPGDGGAAP